MPKRWESCTYILTMERRGQVRCWQPAFYSDVTGRRLCEEHARMLVEQQGLEALKPEDRQRFVDRNKGRSP